jgi:hypothetical protein
LHENHDKDTMRTTLAAYCTADLGYSPEAARGNASLPFIFRSGAGGADLGYLIIVPHAAGPRSRPAAQGTSAIPATPFRGTLSRDDRVIPIQIRWNDKSESRIQMATPIGFDDTTSRPMRRDPHGDTLLAVLPGLGDTIRFAPRLEEPESRAQSSPRLRQARRRDLWTG